MTCACGSPIHPERVELGFHCCIDCSTVEKPLGVNLYGGKTGGELQIHQTRDSYIQFKQDTYRAGKKTGMMLSKTSKTRTKF
jgi:hypothetical protein